MTELRRPEVLSSKHDRRAFDSGEPTLDDWLRRFAGQSRRGDTAATWVVADKDFVVVAFASLSMSAIDLGEAPKKLARAAPDPIPALLLGRLAVDQRFTGIGVGTSLVAHVLATAVELNRTAACRAVVVTAINDRARDWWLRFGFEHLDPDDPDGLNLYLLSADIAATLERLS